MEELFTWNSEKHDSMMKTNWIFLIQIRKGGVIILNKKKKFEQWMLLFLQINQVKLIVKKVR